MTALGGPSARPVVGPPRTARSQAAVWLPAGAAPVSIGGYPVGGGLLYVGRGLTGAYTTQTEPAAVDPGLAVSLGRPEPLGGPRTGRPSYEDLTPGGRAGYLEWLARGRTGRTDIDHVLLFFFGLERRVLVDLATTRDGHQEYEHIAAEVRRLRGAYGTDAGFAERAERFLELVDTLARVSDPDLRPPGAPQRPTGELPVGLRVGIGRYAAAGRPLSARWAYAWHSHHQDRAWRETAAGHPDEFRTAFIALYADSFPDGGMTLPTLPASSPDDLTVAYQPANPGFAGRSLRVHTRVPDIRRMVAPVRQLHAIAALVQDDLEVERERRESTMASAIALLQLAAVVAPPGGLSIAALRDQVAAALQLSADQRDELAAVPVNPRLTDPSVARLAHVPAAQKAAAADLLIAVAGADGLLTPDERRVLGEVFPLIGLDPRELDGRVRQLVSTMDGPDEDDTIVLDLALVNRKISEAAPMAALLSGLLSRPATS